MTIAKISFHCVLKAKVRIYVLLPYFSTKKLNIKKIIKQVWLAALFTLIFILPHYLTFA